MAAVEERVRVKKKAHEEIIHDLVFSKPRMGKGRNVFDNRYMDYEFYSLMDNFKEGSWDNNIAYVVSGARIKLTHRVAQVVDIPNCYAVLSNEKEEGEDSTPKPLYCFKYDEENGYYEQTELDPGMYAFDYLNEKYGFIVGNKKEKQRENLTPNSQKSNFFNKADRNLSPSESVRSSDIQQPQKR
jgi:hypothetical protein